MSNVIKSLYDKLESKEKDLKGLKESYNKTLDFYRSYSDYIDSKSIDEQSNHLANISKEMSKMETEKILLKFVISSLENEKKYKKKGKL